MAGRCWVSALGDGEGLGTILLFPTIGRSCSLSSLDSAVLSRLV